MVLTGLFSHSGAIILGDEEKRPNYDNKGARLNLIRTRTLIDDADVVVVRFGDKYRQWNAAFDAGYATAKGNCLLYTSPSPRDRTRSRMPSSA